MTELNIQFGVIGINHNHIYAQVELMLNAGAEFVVFYAKEPELSVPFAERFPQAKQVAAQVANYAHPRYPELEDFGEMLLKSDRSTGYIRVDWYTPAGLGVWGDGRLTILGTEGYIELLKYIDVGGRAGRNHLLLVDQRSTQYLDCSSVELSYGKQLVQDILDRTETAVPQAHVFLTSHLALEAEARAKRLGYLS